MTKTILERVGIAVLTAIILGGLTLLWNWGSDGGVVRALGGITESDARVMVQQEAVQEGDVLRIVEDRIPSAANQVIQTIADGQERIPSPQGNGKSATCPAGSYMTGMLWQVDSGGPHGIISWLGPVCKTFGR
ncbi:hypothetical protein [Devosia sp.]|uniref:hypothetical protein n=1 Tax=Devosia sp. TaxID=1871048 RepID=UPI003A8CDB0F